MAAERSRFPANSKLLRAERVVLLVRSEQPRAVAGRCHGDKRLIWALIPLRELPRCSQMRCEPRLQRGGFKAAPATWDRRDAWMQNGDAISVRSHGVDEAADESLSES